MDIDVFDLFMVHEDGYSNIIKYLFENIDSFREKLLGIVFNDNPIGVEIKTRSTYISKCISDDNKCVDKKIVPDIILHNENHFCIIEVKVFASEGENQTSRYYDAKDEMMKSLDVKAPDNNQTFYYLSLNDSVKLSSPKFKLISWKKIGECLTDCKSDNSFLNSIIKQLSERISSIDGNVITEKSNWIETITGNKWSMASNLLKALTLNRRECTSNGWASFKKATNEYTLSTLLMPYEDWKGHSLVDNKIDNCHPELYYSIHNEFEYNLNNHVLSFRLDYELNPYYSKKEVESISDNNIRDFVNECNNCRKNIALECRDIWNNKYRDKLSDNNYKDFHYNGHITDHLLVLISGKIEVQPELSVEDVNRIISPFLTTTEDFVKNELLPRIKKEK